MKGAFKEASVQQKEEIEHPAKKKIKLGGPVCNAASVCYSRAVFKIDSSKTMFRKEHYELLSNPAKKGAVKIQK